eukprot:gene7451-8237_t
MSIILYRDSKSFPKAKKTPTHLVIIRPRLVNSQLVTKTTNSEGQDSSRPFYYLPPTDLIETDDAYLIHMDLPGIPPQDIDISLQAGEKASILTIQAERKALFDDKKDKAHSVERVIGKVQRRIRLPGNADCDQTQTSYKEGVLMIRLGKKKQETAEKKRKLIIQTE